ncbi:hypothetical protein [Streptomyces sp. 3213.3]|uniref:hypothetical protein n=1 Tax=Streptomyces sp. 3213.3 TaxID=1855348 RepID=UPI000B820EFF|nr:hypothetical protein [Streptomyces sp. 3213.3]
MTLGLNGLTLGLFHYTALAVAVGRLAATADRRHSLPALVLAIAVLPAYGFTRIGLGRPSSGSTTTVAETGRAGRRLASWPSSPG